MLLLIGATWLLVAGAQQPTEVADNSALDIQLVSDLRQTDVVPTLERQAGRFYLFELIGRQGGGATLIAQLGSDEHCNAIWEGQDYPPCWRVGGVPHAIVPECLEGLLVDRTNIFRTIYLELFHHVNIVD